jgi:hypothetical protein
MTKLMPFAVLVLFLVCVSSSHAAGLYVGGSLGASFVQWEWSDLDEDDIPVEGADFAYKLFGGYKVIPFLAFEGGYRSLGKVSDQLNDITYEAKTTGWDVGAMGVLPLGIAHLWAKAGYFWWTSEGGLMGETTSESGSDFMWGLGGDLSILVIAVRLEWEKFEIENTNHISMFTGGVTFGF